MSGLMIIFLFVSVAYMQSVTREKDKIEQVAITWNQAQETLFLDLQKEFEDDLPRWKASLNRETLSVRFEEPSVFFEVGSAQITDGFKKILDNFFPRYLEILRKYQSSIAEVRIEGHTSSEWAGARDMIDAYFKNMELSQNRTRSVLQYCLTISAVNQELSWAIKTITANGLSSSSPILLENGTEDSSLSACGIQSTDRR
jgi:outer membrane protein OmpA-like peptidoglycan-associated protein